MAVGPDAPLAAISTQTYPPGTTSIDLASVLDLKPDIRKQGNSIRVTSRGLFSADPARLTSRDRNERLRWWAGPWPVDERWWDPEVKAGRTARAQVLIDGDPGVAFLLCYRQRRWYLEGIYE